ncbi:MAG: hypothetical protein HUK08_05425 [Bacteroidaceae bacterium]|nr:hypothetical protein [Bacteroidaceae bacterium]
MKKFLSLALLALLLATAGSGYAQNAATDEFRGAESVKGYVITKNIKVSRSKGAKARYDMSIKAGKACLTADNSTYDFRKPDISEYLILGKDYITYYEPSQDSAPKRFARRSVFNQSANKVTFYKSAPSSWRVGVAVTLVPRIKEYIENVMVKPVVIKEKNAVYLEDGRQKDRKVSMYGKTVYEISFSYKENTERYYIYVYNGAELMKNNFDENGEFAKDFAGAMKVDDKGYCYAKSMEENATFKPCHELSCVVGGIPSIDFVGWISPTQMVIDDMVYDVVK